MTIALAIVLTLFISLLRNLDRGVQKNLQATLLAQTMRTSIERQGAVLDRLLAEDLDVARTMHMDETKRFTLAAKEAEPNLDSSVSQAFNDAKEGVERFDQSILRAFRAKDREARRLIVQTDVDPAHREASKLVGVLVVRAQEAVSEANRKIVEESQSARTIAVVAVVISLIVAIVLARYYVIYALRPLKELAEQAEAIGDGNYDVKIRTRRRDEIGILAQNFSVMAKRLNEVRKKEAERLQVAEALTSAALASLYDPVIIADREGKIVKFNRAAEGLFGSSPVAPRDPVIESVGDSRIVSAILQSVRGEKTKAEDDETNLVPIGAKGAERIYRLRATPMHGELDEILGAVVVLEDITHLREVDRLKTEFIAVASHELRTPVTSLLLSSQILLEGAAGDLNPTQKQVIEAQKEDLARLERLMQELLDLSKLEAGSSPPRFARVSPEELVQGAFASVRGTAEMKSVLFTTEVEPDLPMVRADATQITRVLTNLAANAVRHTPSGGTVKIRAERESNQVRFWVEDTGQGIPTDYLPKIFERFVQVPGATGGGAGLGLPISQAIVLAHGSEIKVESQVGEGSKFTFALAAD
jgi:PAS domain S-box-containing protein